MKKCVNAECSILLLDDADICSNCGRRQPVPSEGERSSGKVIRVGDHTVTASGRDVIAVGGDYHHHSHGSTGEPYDKNSPEQVQARQLVARRAQAAAIDVMIVLAVSFPVGWFLFGRLAGFFSPLLNAARIIGEIMPFHFPGEYNVVVALSLFNFILVSFTYDTLFVWLWHGRTPGKRVRHLRVCLECGDDPGFLLSLWRGLIRQGLWLPFFWTVFLIKDRHALHDWLSATKVESALKADFRNVS